MNDIDSIKAKLEGVRFINFSQYFSDLLSAFEIPYSTIQKLLSVAINDSFRSPIFVYRRAIIIYDTKLKNKTDIEKIEQKYPSIFRLLIVINNELVICKDSVTEEVIEFNPNNVHNHVHFFFPLIYGNESYKDYDTTIDFAKLVGRLYNELCLDDLNNFLKNHIRLIDFTLSLIYLSFGKSILNNKEFEKIIKWVSASQGNNYSSIMEDIFDAVFLNRRHSTLYNNLPHWKIYRYTKNILPHINARSFDASAKIICYDLANIDTEILGSLIYKLVQNDHDQTIYGHQTSYQNVAKVLNPLFINKYEKLIEESHSKWKHLKELKKGILELIFFDPTNGPGCFLTASFNSIVNLVSSIDKLLGENGYNKVNVGNFVGLVDSDLSLKLSHLSLWVSYLQYLQRFSPVQESDLHKVYELIAIHKGDQLQCNWDDVCPNKGNTLIIGAPTFKGAKKTTKAEKTKNATGV